MRYKNTAVTFAIVAAFAAGVVVSPLTEHLISDAQAQSPAPWRWSPPGRSRRSR